MAIVTDGVTHARSISQSLEDWARDLPLLFLSNSRVTADVSKAARRGLVRSVGRRLYTTDLSTPLEELLRKNALIVASSRFPGCVLSHRSALEMRPVDGHLFLTGPKTRTERWPGLTLKVKRGPGPLDDDMPVLALHAASHARAYLENLSYRRRSAGPPRSLSRAQIEARLEAQLRQSGEAGLNSLRDRARALAGSLAMSDAAAELDELIGALLGTRAQVKLEAPTAIARSEGAPYDEDRLELFEALRDELVRDPWCSRARPREPSLRAELQHLAFIDAYFSNYIEGTKFEIGVAKQIVFENKIPCARPIDAHDISGTFELLVDDSEMTVSALEFDAIDDFEHLLQRRHERIMAARPDKRPGEFKRVASRAGATTFVAPELVRATLERGLGILHQLPNPFGRAVFMMFLITEVHPFDDGNGRLARVMMNAELAAHGENRILVPTSYRPDYLGALRRLSHARAPRVFVRMLDRAQEFSARLEYSDLDALVATLEGCNAFDDSERRILKLPPVRAS